MSYQIDIDYSFGTKTVEPLCKNLLVILITVPCLKAMAYDDQPVSKDYSMRSYWNIISSRFIWPGYVKL